jgi:SAM-dependent methyltransferase
VIEAAEIQKEEMVGEDVEPLPKLDLACGDNKEEGFVGVDLVKTSSVDVQFDLTTAPWPWHDNSIGEARCSHFFEHLNPQERVLFMNELHRVLRPGAGCLFVTPRGYDRQAQDPGHKWPPVVEASYYYFDKEWLVANKLSHYLDLYGIRCNFEPRPMTVTVTHEFAMKNDEHKLFAIRNYTNAAVDLVVLMVKREEKKDSTDEVPLGRGAEGTAGPVTVDKKVTGAVCD